MDEIFHVTFPGLGWAFTFDRTAFHLGGLTVRWYGIIIAAGFMLAFIYAMKAAPRFKVDPDQFIDCVIVGLIAGIVGARLYYVIFAPDDRYIREPISILYTTEGGLAIYGGVIGGLLGGILMAKKHKMRIMAVLDIAALGFLIGQGIGRWGNFFNQEAFGVQTDLPWRMVSEGTGNIPVHPCFLYESVWCLLGFALLHFYSKKYKRFDGQIFWMYLVWYGAERFVVEGLRTDSLYLIGLNIRVSQLLALVTVLVGICCIVYFLNRGRVKVPAVEAEALKEEGCGGDCAHCMGSGLDGEPQDASAEAKYEETGEPDKTVGGDAPETDEDKT